MTVLSTRWRFDNYTKKGEFYIEKNNHEKVRETVYIQATHYRTPFILTRFCTENTKFHLAVILGTIETKVDLPL